MSDLSRPTRPNTLTETGIFVGGGGIDYQDVQSLRLDHGNRHGLIAGATGTGKTVTLQVLAEGFSDAGVPVFMADVKGDLSGLAQAGSETAKLHKAFQARAETIGFDIRYRAYPTVFWDVFGQQGIPVRTTISEMGPVLLTQLLGLSPAQEGVLHIAFHLADQEGLALLDLDDLRALLLYVSEKADEIQARYGNVDARSIGAIQRQLLILETEGAGVFFGEPALSLPDMLRSAPDGRGQINILAADKLINSPKVYATFLLWILSELFETLPEVGNPEKPVCAFFFDEAHLLFDDAPKPLLEKIEQVARLIRSKGVGIYFVTQNPTDIPDDVLSQLGNRVQHALRAFTAKDQKNLERAAETYRDNPRFSILDTLRDVGTGEALTSFLDRKGIPGIAERTLIRPPMSKLGPIADVDRQALIRSCDLFEKYRQPVNPDSAYEILQRRAGQSQESAQPSEEKAHSHARRYSGTHSKSSSGSARRSSDTILETFGKSFARQLGSRSGQALVRGLLGSLFRK
ncbi:helicase HerA-like domain-containing protein [Thioclava litoralis]|uniref:Helicase HerA-like domain-containing protein n=1 Tax=Thioclava litoralis TaxID=3076557 RepID=A0ABZ1DYJ3_9RHOB|nr:helicase HerA-like domain-containing protein [Thioclava sp. FTW29]